MNILHSFVIILTIFALSFFMGSHVVAATAKRNITPTPTPIQVCLAEITYAKNPKTHQCKSFSSSCGVPKNWIIVPECSR